MAEKETPVEEVVKLYQMGLSDSEVIRRLTEEGFSPVHISDALNQAKIKQEIDLSELKPLTLPPSMAQMKAPAMQSTSMSRPTQLPPLTSLKMPQAPAPPVQMQTYQAQAAPQRSQVPEIPVPKPSAIPPMPTPQPRAQRPAPTQQRQSMQPMEETSAYPYAYPTYQEEQAPPKIETEAIEEIAEQIVDEKWQEVKTKISDVIEWKSYADRRINSIDERIKRLESSIDRLQAALLSKVNEYGRGIKELGSEMNSLEGALGKILSPLVDNVKELGRITEDLKTSSGDVSTRKKTVSRK